MNHDAVNAISEDVQEVTPLSNENEEEPRDAPVNEMHHLCEHNNWSGKPKSLLYRVSSICSSALRRKQPKPAHETIPLDHLGNLDLNNSRQLDYRPKISNLTSVVVGIYIAQVLLFFVNLGFACALFFQEVSDKKK